MITFLNDVGPIDGSIRFSTKDTPDFVVLKNNGEFIVKGKLVTEDLELYKAMKEFFLMLRDDFKLKQNENENV